MPSIVTRLGLLTAVAFLSACGDGRGDNQVARLEAGVLFRNDGPELDAVDPHLAGGAWTQTVTGDLFVGLMRRGPDGRPELALAERYDLSEDGLTWTFTLREAQWSDGRAITADDVVYSFSARGESGDGRSLCRGVRAGCERRRDPEWRG